MFGSTTLVTVGHALDRAQQEGMDVRVNVAGEWINGRIVNNDGHGVAILESTGDLCVEPWRAHQLAAEAAVTGRRVPRSAPRARRSRS